MGLSHSDRQQQRHAIAFLLFSLCMFDYFIEDIGAVSSLQQQGFLVLYLLLALSCFQTKSMRVWNNLYSKCFLWDLDAP